MAWDAPRRSPDGLPYYSADHHLLRVDEVKINNSQTLHSLDVKANMGPPLSPIHEETRILVVDAPLQVTVTVRFHDPAVRSVYCRTYFSSQSFRPTQQICRGLLRRISHCSQELITRQDSDALNPTQCLRKGPKQLRFELAFELHRKGHPDAWGWSTYRSYQKQPVTRASAKDVVGSTHAIVGMFLARHDKYFRLTDDPSHEYFPKKPETFKPPPAGPLDLTCVPRSRFIESTQTWEFVPGYSLEFTFKSSNPARYQPEVKRTLRIDSRQTAPLNLGFSEDLLWHAYRSLQDVLDQKKNDFDVEHASCDGLNGVADCECQHFEEDALHVELHLVNNLGPIYDHLSRTIQSRLRLFSHPTGQDCDDFVLRVAARLREFRDRTDKKVEKLNDFDLRVTELTGHGWQENNAARFIIDGKQNHSRRTIAALLDRVRTSVCDVLRGYDVAIRMVAYKRGHLVLDKALIARKHQSTPSPSALDSSTAVKQAIVAELNMRIARDIKMICEDTCDLGDEAGATPTTPTTPEPKRQRFRPYAAPSLPSTPRLSAPPIQRWDLPGSPGSFTTRPPTPPQVPPRISSIRVFPLVPAKYTHKKERSINKPSMARDSAVGMGFEGDYRVLNATASSESVVSLRVPPAVHENHRENAFQDFGNNALGLRPAAEVYPALKNVDCETDSNSTHSSLPALTESDSPSPEPNMLVTPNFVQSASPSRRGVPLYIDPDLHLSAPPVLNFSAPNSATFSEVDGFADPKTIHPSPGTLPGRPMTPSRAVDAQNLPLVDTPKPSLDCSGDEKTPLAHRQMHGSTCPEVIRESGTEQSALDDASVTNRSNSQSSLQSHSESQPEMNDPAIAAESSEPAQDDQPIEYSLPHYRDGDAHLDPASLEDCDLPDTTAAVAQCDSSETLKPFTFSEPRSIDDVTNSRLQASDMADDSCVQAVTAKEEEPSCAAARLPTSDISIPVSRESQDHVAVDEADFVAETETPDSISLPDATDASGIVPVPDELSSIKPGFSEHDGDSAIGSEDMDYLPISGDGSVPDAETRSVGLSDASETADHVMPFSDSGVEVGASSEISVVIGPEVDGYHLLSPADEDVSELDDIESGPKEGSDRLESGLKTASGPSAEAVDRRADDPSAGIPTSSLCMEFEASETFHDDSEAVEQTSPVPTRAPTPLQETVSPPKARSSVPAFEACRWVSDPPTTHLGLGSNSLLPALPILGSLKPTDANISTTRNSWSSSSSWEDFVSTGRQSSDSVDTVRPSPLASEGEEDAECPKRLGTPTAGFLGLHESRWADFGIRTALTGTHAFDRPSTAPLSNSPKGNHEGVGPHELGYASKGTAAKHTKSSSTSKAFHLRKKASIGSIVPGRLNKKGSRDLKKNESKDFARPEKVAKAKSKAKEPIRESTSTMIEDDSSGRFPRAMMIVAGLAFASSVVSRNHS